VFDLQNFIQQYLDRGLFNIADNEERLQKLQASAVTLADEFIQDKIFLVQFLRASLTEKVDDESPALAKIEEHIKASWSTFRSAQPERPIAILLAVGWQGLRLAVSKASELAALVWYGSVNLLAAEKIDSRLELVIEFVQVQGINLESRAAAEWSSRFFEVPEQLSPIHVQRYTFPLQQWLLKASANVDQATGTPLDGGNPHNPGQDGAWALFFSKTAEAGFSTVLNSLVKALVEAIQPSFDELKEKLDAVSTELGRGHAAQSRSTELLWLAESLFSPRTQKSYRELSSHEVVLAMAADMAEAATGVSPQSVEYFLAETIEKLFPTQTAKLDAFVRDLSKSTIRNSLPTALFEQTPNTRYLGLLEFVGAISANAADSKKFTERTGFNKNASKPLGELARWIYREIKFTECLKEDLWS
jgi:hypothetical protein